MRILFISNKVFPSTDANGKIIENIGRELQKEYNIESDYLTMTIKENFERDSNPIEEYNIEGHDILQINPPYFTYKNHFNENKNLIDLLKTLTFIAIRRCSYGKIDKWLISLVNKFISKKDYECIIFVSNPHKAAYLINRVKSNAKKMWFMLDPFTNNVILSPTSNKLNLLLEKSIYKHIDSVFMPNLIYNENKEKQIFKYKDKMHTYQFPNIIENNNIGKDKTFSTEHITIVFVGFLYPDIRNPKYFLDLLCNSNSKIQLYIVGGTWGKFEDGFFEKYQELLGDRFKILGKKNTEECAQILNQADILLNIGNSIPNMIPSKIFEYISTGKPILNVCKLDNCPTLVYMEKYDNCLNLFESEGIDAQQVEQFEKFCFTSIGKRIPFEQIKDTYKEATLEYVVKQLLDEAMKKN